MDIRGYPKIYNLGHNAVRDLFNDTVLVQEKVDGSQFSFGVYDGEACARSKNKQIVMDAPDNLFAEAVAVVNLLSGEGLLQEGWTYRGEYLKKPGHNHLAYDRIPNNHIVLFDIDKGDQDYCDREELEREARRLGLEIVPEFYVGKVESVDMFKKLLDTKSFLGGQKIEGVVIKSRTLYGIDKKILMGKYVSDDYRETQKISWKNKNPSGLEIREQIAQQLRTDRRWEKAIERLRDDGGMENSPTDIGPLIKIIQQDLRDECADLIKEQLYDWAQKHIYQRAIAGFPEWYKERLLRLQFGDALDATKHQQLSTSTEDLEQR